MSVDAAFARIARPMEQVFDYIIDPAGMELWNLGTRQIETDGTGLSHGISASTGATVFFRIQAYRDQMLVDYHVGSDPAALLPYISMRVLPGAMFGDDGCGLLMTAVRTAGVDDARWQVLVERHAREVELIKKAVEAA